MRERLKVVVTVYGRIVVYRDLSENLGKNDNVKRDNFVEERERKVRVLYLHAYYRVDEKEHYD